MNQAIKSNANFNEQVSAFPIPFTLESFRNDILEVFLYYIRTIHQVIESDKATEAQLAWRLTGLPPLENGRMLCDPEYFDEINLGLKFQHIQDSMLAKYLESLYEFAFFARKNLSTDVMEYESRYMWVTDLVVDALRSHASEQWDDYGCNIRAAAERCVFVAETANARCILEDGRCFSYFSGGKDLNQSPNEESLTIRQMALLSGMEEMSIRSAANPKRANKLITHTVEKGSTRVARAAAKDWLKIKGRYIPVTFYSSSELNLSKQKFTSYPDLLSALDARLDVISARIGEDVLKKHLGDLGIQNSTAVGLDKYFVSMSVANFSNEVLIRKIADVLNLPQELLVLRCQQTAASEHLAQVEHQLAIALDAVKSAESDKEVF